MTERPEPAPRRGRIPRLVFAGALFVFLFSAAYNYFVFDHVPHIHDEMAALFQARILLTGHFSAPSPPARESFDFPHMINDGRWYGMYPPGWPLLLALGLIARAPWLVNPLLGALTIFLLFFLGAEIYGRKVGILAAVLGSLSIWLLLMSATMMSHPASLVFGAVFLLYFFRSLRRPTVGNGLAAGLGFGLAYLCRPYNAVVLAIPFLLVLAFRFFKEFRTRWKNALAMALPAALCAGFFLYYNAMTTGDPFKPGYLIAHGQEYATIFGRPATLDYDYTPLVAAGQIAENMAALNDDLFGWPLTSLWPLAFVLWAALKKPRERSRDLLLFSGFASMVVGFFFFWGAFIIIGARMFFDALPLLVLLCAKGLSEAGPLLAGRFPKIGRPAWRKIGAVVLAASTVYAFAVRFPAWARPSGTEWFYERYDHNFAGSSAWIHNAVEAAGLHGAIVVLKLVYAPLTGFPTGWWSSGFLYDTPRLDGEILFATDRGEAGNLALLRAFPGRSVYLYAGTLEKGVLVPLREDNGALTSGPPIVPARTPRRAVELVSGFEGLFRMYSPAFREFVERTIRSEGLTGLDVDRLARIGRGFKERRDFQSAAYAFEAALQIEKNYKPRWPLLMDLTFCYVKLGRADLARRINAKFEASDLKGRGLYFVIPERGF